MEYSKNTTLNTSLAPKIPEGFQQLGQPLRYEHFPWAVHFLTHRKGMLYFLSPVAVLALQRWPARRGLMTAFGLAVVVLSLLVASFANNVSELLVTQGAMYGIGGAFLYNPFVFYLDEWFVERKGLAFGILWAGTGISGTLVPLLMDWGLEKYGFRIMLRFWALVIVSDC